MHQRSDHLLINGKLHALSDCQHWRLDRTGPSCAKGYDLNLHPCAGCQLYEARADDPLRRRQPARELVAISKRLEFGDVPPQLAAQPQPGLIRKAVSWLTAEASALVSSVSDETYQQRISACQTCPQLEPLPAPQVGHCKACGCGKRARAELTVKGRMPAAKCPQKLWPA